jgi:hypothetical protein
MKPTCPVAIGGVGGSGTRVVARALQQLGYFMGHDLNHAQDNLSFTLLFKRREMLNCTDAEFQAVLDIFVRAMTRGAPPWTELDLQRIHKAAHPSNVTTEILNWFATRVELLQELDNQQALERIWGWKEPNTHMLLDRLFKHLPQLKYIHVRRNGLDMAYSSNQNQLIFWGESLLGTRPSLPPEPIQALAYWCAAERRVAGIIAQPGVREHCHVVEFDGLCSEPEVEWRALLRFLGRAEDEHLLSELVKLVVRPASLGRRYAHGISRFSGIDLAFIRSMGYDRHHDKL